MMEATTAGPREKYLSDYHQHLQHQRKQRLRYYHHRQKATEQPEKYGSMIVDAMDQSKAYLMHLRYRSKEFQEAPKLKQKLMCCLVHGNSPGSGAYVYLQSPPVAQGANFVIETIARTLKKMEENRTAAGMRPLPKTLYLQLDNASDNKNYTLLEFCSTLVETGKVDKVKIGFLLVGHTHEAVDQ